MFVCGINMVSLGAEAAAEAESLGCREATMSEYEMFREASAHLIAKDLDPTRIDSMGRPYFLMILPPDRGWSVWRSRNLPDSEPDTLTFDDDPEIIETEREALRSVWAHRRI